MALDKADETETQQILYVGDEAHMKDDDNDDNNNK